MRHTVVLSDIHLCEIEPEDGLWMRYRQAPYIPDHEIAAMLGELRQRVRGEQLELVFNGDVFDFDAPRVIDGESRFHDLPRSFEHTAPMLRAILADHPVFVRAVGEVLAEGHRVVFISGNHDMQLTLPGLRAILTERLVEAARQAGCQGDPTAQIVYRAWFHRTEDRVVIEHGSQYDDYCALRYPMAPSPRAEAPIPPTVGSLTGRHLISRMGFFNPHVEASYMLTAAGYVEHWAKCYLPSRHSVVMPWLVGSVKTMAELVRTKEERDGERQRDDHAMASQETGVELSTVQAHAGLFATPANDNLLRVLRELWLDRVLLLAAGAGFAALWLTWSQGAGALGAALAPAVFAGYERLMPKPPLDDTWGHVHRMARQVGRVHGASAVVFGHTHRVENSWEDGVFFGNSGSWSPAFHDLACTRPLEDAWPLVWLKGGPGRVHGGLTRWRRGDFIDG